MHNNTSQDFQVHLIFGFEFFFCIFICLYIFKMNVIGITDESVYACSLFSVHVTSQAAERFLSFS